ncbi:polymeric immunoglobulin receptor-like [Rhinatrema bivittatum]|uniref:polymeric immunoglobulin receptor-like n=1 Tax=Rhinatrema bivittatum TaxID=194408 RepID=UPI0011287697|nr:polymeric immunoglobulin receptor-like [Rhinatrema bivittatum]
MNATERRTGYVQGPKEFVAARHVFRKSLAQARKAAGVKRPAQEQQGCRGLRGPREVRGLVGGSLSLQCQYERGYETLNKYWCRGDTWILCHILIQTESNRHITQGRLTIQDNVAALTFIVTMEELTQGDSGKYWCGIENPLLDPGDPVSVIVLSAGSWGFRDPEEVRGVVGGSLSLQCQYERGYDINRKYWCRGEEWSSCHILAETESEAKDRISITENFTAHTFTVTMDQLTKADSGKYWCGIEGLRWNYGDPVIVTALPEGSWGLTGQREVKGLAGGSLTLQCQYESVYAIKRKYWCRGEAWSSCDVLVDTESKKKRCRISIRDDPAALMFTVTMKQLTEADSGKYWCGIERPLWDSGVPAMVTVLPEDSWDLIKRRVVRVSAGGSLSLQCQYKRGYEANSKYWCKGEKWNSCKLLIKAEPEMKGRIIIRDDATTLTFTVTMEQLTEADSGKYWCGVDGRFWDSSPTFIVTVLPAGSWGLSGPREVRGPVGRSLSLQCQYQKGNDTGSKYWCKGENWSSCDVLAEAESETKGRVAVRDNVTALSFTVTMEQLTQADSGRYWCGTEGLRWNYGDPVIVTVLPASSSLMLAEKQMKTGAECTDAMTGSEEEGPAVFTPHSTSPGESNAHFQGSSPSMITLYILMPAIFLLLMVLLTVILIKTWRRNRAMKEDKSRGTENVIFSIPVTPKATEDVHYSTVNFPVNPHLESPQAETPQKSLTRWLTPIKVESPRPYSLTIRNRE